jgi:hypothetical protein
MKVWHSKGYHEKKWNIRVAMKRMAVSNVLIVGVQGLGVEIGEFFPLSLDLRLTMALFSQEHRSCWCQIRYNL